MISHFPDKLLSISMVSNLWKGIAHDICRVYAKPFLKYKDAPSRWYISRTHRHRQQYRPLRSRLPLLLLSFGSADQPLGQPTCQRSELSRLHGLLLRQHLGECQPCVIKPGQAGCMSYLLRRPTRCRRLLGTTNLKINTRQQRFVPW